MLSNLWAFVLITMSCFTQIDKMPIVSFFWSSCDISASQLEESNTNLQFPAYFPNGVSSASLGGSEDRQGRY